MTTEEQVISLIARMFKRNAADLSKSTLLKEDLNAKSMNLLEISAMVENEFNIDIPMDRITKVKSIGDILALVDGAGR